MPSTSDPPIPRWSRRRAPAQGLVEYGLIVALVAGVAVAGLVALRPASRRTLTGVGASV